MFFCKAGQCTGYSFTLWFCLKLVYVTLVSTIGMGMGSRLSFSLFKKES